MSTEDDFADLDEDEEQRAEEETTSRGNYFQHCLGMLRIIILQKKDNQSGELLSALPRHAADHNSTKKRGPVRGTTFSTLGMPWTIILHRKDDQSGELLSALSSHAADYTIAKKRRLFRGTTFCNALVFRGL